MIREVLNKSGANAITSDQWHVVHARFVRGQERPFLRRISSEHEERVACLAAARRLRARIARKAVDVPPQERDQVFVRKPHYKSLKTARRWAKPGR